MLCLLQSFTAKNRIFLFFLRVHSPRPGYDYGILLNFFTLLLWNRLRMNEKFFNFFIVFIFFIQEKKRYLAAITKSSSLSSQILKPVLFTLHEKFYSFTCVIICIRKISGPTPTTYSPQKIHPTFFLPEMVCNSTSRIINSVMVYQEVFPSKRNLSGISHFSFLIIISVREI